MNKKLSKLPHIEDATFLACLDSRADQTEPPIDWDEELPPDDPAWSALELDRLPPLPPPAAPHLARPAHAAANDQEDGPKALPSLAAWRAQADEEFAEFRVIAQFLAKSDAELAAAVEAHPRQMHGFAARLSRILQRRSMQQQMMTVLLERMHQAMLRAATDMQPTGGEAQRPRPRPRIVGSET